METLILYGQLFGQFFKTGLFAVGGGLATLPFLQEMSRLTHWFTTTDIADMVAVSESTPGPGRQHGDLCRLQNGGICRRCHRHLRTHCPSIITHPHHCTDRSVDFNPQHRQPDLSGLRLRQRPSSCCQA